MIIFDFLSNCLYFIYTIEAKYKRISNFIYTYMRLLCAYEFYVFFFLGDENDVYRVFDKVPPYT